jgi:benzylsuccinate CoA-transferase BbsE subunit
MINNQDNKSILSPYRILDLTEGGCMLGGRLLADMGADVIKIEPPGGSPSRVAPYYKNIQHAEKSLYWLAYNANKRGITLDISRTEGKTLFRRLVKDADVIIESFAPGYLDSLGLGYTDLCQTKPDIILSSITPFGQNGPKSDYKAGDLVAWASGGYLYACGNPDRPPVWISFPQTCLFGGAEAAIGSMMAIWNRARTGEGQLVDISLQECAVSPNLNVLQMWDVSHIAFQRTGGAMYVPSTGVRQPIYFKCLDGYVMILVQGGNEPFISSSSVLVKWMDELNMAPDWLNKLNWKTDYDATTMRQEIADKVGEAVENFTLTLTKHQLYQEGAIRRHILLAPVFTTKDISEDIQLKTREFWVKLTHPELDADITYCGPFIGMSETPIKYIRRAPLIGEHNTEIYSAYMGLSDKELTALKAAKII